MTGDRNKGEKGKENDMRHKFFLFEDPLMENEVAVIKVPVTQCLLFNLQC